jgi:hypothetical protein
VLRHTIPAVIALVLLIAVPAGASPLLSIQGPAAYTPGDTFQCTVFLTGADHLASFSMDLVLSAAAGTAGTDFFFDDATQPASQYVFTGQPTVGFSHSATGTGLITVGDSLSSLTGEVSTVGGVNDRAATLSVKTSAAMTGDLVLSFDAGYLTLDTSAFPPESIPDFGGLVSSLQPLSIPLAPEPATMLLLCAGAAGAIVRRKRLRARA